MGEEFKTMIIGNSGLAGEKVKTWLLDLGIYHVLRQWEPTHLKKKQSRIQVYTMLNWVSQIIFGTGGMSR